ncbi:MAG: hypothetical protein ACKO96_24205, partial [Flammeovirgaceae bacterium]
PKTPKPRVSYMWIDLWEIILLAAPALDNKVHTSVKIRQLLLGFYPPPKIILANHSSLALALLL